MARRCWVSTHARPVPAPYPGQHGAAGSTGRSAAPKHMTEGEAIHEIQELLDGLPDDDARKRVVEWVRAKYERKVEPAVTPQFSPMTSPRPNNVVMTSDGTSLPTRQS